MFDPINPEESEFTEQLERLFSQPSPQPSQYQKDMAAAIRPQPEDPALREEYARQVLRSFE
jgi:hypothetical protein